MWPVKLSTRALVMALARDIAAGAVRLMKPHAVAVIRHGLEVAVRFGLWL